MNRVATLALALLVLGGSGFGASLLLSAREAPAKKQRQQRGVAVKTLQVKQALHRLDVQASGVVVPARDLDVFPQVSGRTVWLYKNLVPGTFVKKGQALYRIDPKNYQLRVEQQEAELRRAKSALELEFGRQEIARSELEILERTSPNPGSDLEENALALRKPQLDAAQGDLAAAEAALERARLDNSRTSFAPQFDAVVVESDAEIGQLATPQTRLARLVGTGEFWVRVALAKDKLPHVAIAGIGGKKGALAEVRQEVGEQVIKRTGRVIRLLSNLEPGSRMARVLVEIDDPYGLEASEEESERPLPILLDAYVDVVIRGKQERQLIKLPERAVREGNIVHVFDPDTSSLSIRKVEVAWRENDDVLVSAGLSDGERVIISPLAAAVEGMKLRDVSSEQKQP